MKRLLSLILLAIFMQVCFIPSSYAVDATATLGTVLRYKDIEGRNNRTVIPITFTANSGTAAMATYSLVPATHNIQGWYLWKVIVDPGTTGPTNGAYDVTITDANSYVVSRNKLDNLSSTTTAEVFILDLILDTWSITITDNAVNSGQAVVKLIFVDN